MSNVTRVSNMHIVSNVLKRQLIDWACLSSHGREKLVILLYDDDVCDKSVTRPSSKEQVLD